MPRFFFSRIERVVATWSVTADSLEEAVREVNGDFTKGCSLYSEECTDVEDTFWKDENGEPIDVQEIEERLAEEEDAASASAAAA